MREKGKRENRWERNRVRTQERTKEREGNWR